MEISNERVSKLVETLAELAEVSGTYAETRIVPNLEVIDDSPADLSTDYIIVRDEEGYYVPVVKTPGLTIATGDYVNVLYIKGTEPIAIQQGSESGSAGFPLTTKGDLLGYSTLVDRYPISGNDGFVLTEDSTADFGFAWKPPVALATYYFHDAAADVATYEQALLTPTDGATVTDSVVVSSATSPALIDSYVTYPTTGIGTTLLPAGVWDFIIWGRVGTVVGVSTILIRVYQRTSGGVETLLFSVETPALTAVNAEYDVTYVQPTDIFIADTDRLVFKVYGTTTSVPNRTVYWLYEGTTMYSHVDTPAQVPGATTGGNVWPLADECNISDTAYATIELGLVALAGNDQLIIGEGSYTTSWGTGGGRIPTTSDVLGSGIDVTNIANTAAVGVTLEIEGDSLLEAVSLTNNVASGVGLAFDNGATGRAHRVKSTVTATGTIAAFFAISTGGATTALLENCLGYASGATNNYAIWAYDTSTGSVAVTVRGGYYSGDVVADGNAANIYLEGPIITGNVTEQNSGTVTGWYYDSSLRLRRGSDQSLVYGPEGTTYTNDVFYCTTASNSDFVSTIATLPGGATLTYTAPSSGAAGNLVPVSTSHIAKMVLHNTTAIGRGDPVTYGLISNCNTGTSTITLTANVPGTWLTTDAITIRSQTNTATFGSTSYFMDFEFVSSVPTDTDYIWFQATMNDSGGANYAIIFHPYEANNNSKRRNIVNQVAGINMNNAIGIIALGASRRFCAGWSASGSGTLIALARAIEVLRQIA